MNPVMWYLKYISIFGILINKEYLNDIAHSQHMTNPVRRASAIASIINAQPHSFCVATCTDILARWE